MIIQHFVFSEYHCGDGISEDCQAEYDNPVNNGNKDYFYQRCATEEGPDPLRSRCSLCCNGNNDNNDALRTCAGPNAEINLCDSSDTEGQNMCVCNHNGLCNQFCNVCDKNSANSKNHTFPKLVIALIGLLTVSNFIINI